MFELNSFHLLLGVYWLSANILVGQWVVEIFSTPIYPIQLEKVAAREHTDHCPGFHFVTTETMLNQIFKSPLAAFPKTLSCNENNEKILIFKTLFPQGVAIGALLFGVLGDGFGRKKVSAGILLLGFLSLIITTQTKSSLTFFIWRFLLGMSAGGVLVVVNVYIMESVSSKQRMVINGIFNQGWMCYLLATICYLTQNWKSTYYVSAACLTPALVLSIFLPESAVWLHNKKKTERLIKSEKRMTTLALIPYEPTERPAAPAKTTILSTLLNTKNYLPAVFFAFLWSAALSAVENFTPHHTELKKVSPFEYYALLGLLAVIGRCVIFMVDWKFEKFNRRVFLIVSGAAIVLFLLGMSTWWKLTNLSHLEIYFWVGSVLCGFLVDFLFLSTMEHVETNLRATILGFFVMVGQSLVIVMKTKSRKTNKNQYCVENLAFAVWLTLSIGCVCVYMRETKNVKLEEAKLPNKKSAEQEDLQLMEQENNV